MAIELNNRHHLQDDDEVHINAFPSPGTPNPMDSDDDDDDGSSDTSSILTELEEDEFADHFREHRDRLFHSHGNLPYPLPVDGNEQAVCRHLILSLIFILIEFFQRLNVQHRILRDLLGSHFVGPVAEALAYQPGRQKRVLDLCTGTGRWQVILFDWTLIHLIRVLDLVDRLMDMASQFRHVRFSGVDIGACMTRCCHSATSTLLVARSCCLTLSTYSSDRDEASPLQRPLRDP